LVWTFHLIFFLLHSFLERIARCGISMDVGQSDDFVWWDILLLRFLCNDVECFMVLVLWFSALIGRLDVWRNQQLEDRKCSHRIHSSSFRMSSWAPTHLPKLEIWILKFASLSETLPPCPCGLMASHCQDTPSRLLKVI
jgi:hypothetical protein